MGWSKKPPGCSLVAFFRLTRATCDEFRAGRLTAQAKLWQRLVRAGVSSRKDLSFKAIGQLPAESLSQLPSMLQGYNGKPALVTDSASFVRHRTLPDVLEIDIDVGLWAFLARQTLYSYSEVLAE